MVNRVFSFSVSVKIKGLCICDGKDCSVYVVDDDEGVERGLTSWEEELVCVKEVKVQNEIRIVDLYKSLVEEE